MVLEAGTIGNVFTPSWLVERTSMRRWVASTIYGGWSLKRADGGVGAAVGKSCIHYNQWMVIETYPWSDEFHLVQKVASTITVDGH